jgi:hypothetical protein
MISAMYENGGNMTHRFLDGHPEMFVYPFESQLGTRGVTDALSAAFPVKYRWPVFSLHGSPTDDYHAIIDEECKVRARTPHVSKFRHMPFEFSDVERLERYVEQIRATDRSRAANVAAFFRATFDAWKDYRRTGSERVYVGYSPIIVVDAERILTECPEAHVLHVVRNPWSAYADTKKRPVPLSLEHYLLGWTLNQYAALVTRRRFPERMHIVRTEDVMGDPQKTLGAVCASMGLSSGDSLRTPTWNGAPLESIAPWGTIGAPTLAANQAAADSLSSDETAEIRDRASIYLDIFDYK